MENPWLLLAVLAASLAAQPGLAAGTGGGLPSSSGSRVDAAAAYKIGLVALKNEDFKAAERKFGDVLSVAPKNPEANYYMALAKSGLGKSKQAVRYLERAISERPNFIEARERLALVSVEIGDAEAARIQLAAIKIISIDCAVEGACNGPFKVQVEVAVQRINEALLNSVDEKDHNANPDDAYDQSGAPRIQSEDAGNHSMFSIPGNEGTALYGAAVRLINEARYEEAIATLLDAQSVVGPHPDILNYLGYAHRKLGKLEAAKTLYLEALAIDENHLGANEYLGELYLEIGDISRARRQLAKLNRLCVFGCVEREDLARLIFREASDRHAVR